VRWWDAVSALSQGYFLKEVIANNLNQSTAPMTNSMLWAAKPSVELVAMLIGYSAQIFADFEGYSLIAIGLGRLFGYELPINFHRPYFADSFAAFWRSWHISLSSWLRDYLYIPLGGNQVRPFRMALNLVIVMFLGGLWHGAAWTFVVWGLLHGSYLVIERVIRIFFEDKPWASSPVTRVVAGFATYGAVCVAWVFFRASDFTIASRMLSGMFGGHPTGDMILTTRELLQIAIVTACVIGMHWAMREESFETTVMRLPAWAITAIGSVMAFAIIFTQGTSNAFIYFQF